MSKSDAEYQLERQILGLLLEEATLVVELRRLDIEINDLEQRVDRMSELVGPKAGGPLQDEQVKLLKKTSARNELSDMIARLNANIVEKRDELDDLKEAAVKALLVDVILANTNEVVYKVPSMLPYTPIPAKNHHIEVRSGVRDLLGE